ncbi:MAG TPA: carboxypeptidase-like regulatory domain-containing protein, partial [Acidobacteriota bacterium]|nr:carboxypeptidase-like regulatory domain-containing protein [Acidobacteriota bacterium]
MSQSKDRRGSALRILVASFIVLGLAHGAAFAANGKISGQVLDKNTKEPVPSCPVQVEGTTLGALTDMDGKFSVLAVPVGEHSVKAQVLGYTAVIVRNVLVKPNQTTPVSFELEVSAIDLPAIIVFREKDMIQMDLATTKRDVTAEKIRTLPVTNVADILKTQAGVSVRNDRFHVRGGRSTELLYNVDGVSMTDPLGGRGPTQALNLSGTEIENISIVKGAWSPEYGGTSGIVNVSTKSGSHDVTRGHIEYFTDNFGTDNLNTYSDNFNRLEFTLGGPEPLFTRHLLPALGLGEPSNKLAYFISLDFNRTDTYTAINHYTSETNMAQFRQTEILGFRVMDRQQNSGNALLKLTYRLSPDIRLNGQFKKTYERNMMWRWAYRYTPNTIPWEEDENDMYNVRWTHNLGPSTYYEVMLSRFSRTYWQRPGDPNVPGGTYEPDDFLFSYQSEDYLDRNANGVWDPPESWTDTYPNGQYDFGDIFEDRDGDGLWTQGTASNPGDSLLYDFNGNNEYDFDSGERYQDGNQNGIWDAGDQLTLDGNGNGTYDAENDINLFDNTEGQRDNDNPEPFIDGDVSLGEPFTDVNRNGVWDGLGVLPGYPLGEPFQDLSIDGKYQGPQDRWVEGVPFRDLNGNNIF